MAVTLLTVSQYARHRGCDEKAVRKAIDGQRITVIERDGKRWIDPDVADIQWARNTRARVRPSQAESPAPAEPAAPPAQAQVAEPDADGLDLDLDNVSYNEASRVLKIEEARLRRLERMEMERKLTDAEAVGRAIWTAYRTLRDTVMPLGRRLAPRVSAMSSEHEIRLLLEAELRGALEAFRARILAPVAAEHAAPGSAAAPQD